jgi:galactose mutarotase-like enzyme
MRLAGHDAPLVLGYSSFKPYEMDTAFFGAVVGRYANRIRDGRFTIAGQRYQTERTFSTNTRCMAARKVFRTGHGRVRTLSDI